MPTEHEGLWSSCSGAGQDTSPSRGTRIPASFAKYSGGLIRLYGSWPWPERFARGTEAVRRIGEVADELRNRVGREREVGLDDPRVRAGLAIHRTGEPHHPRPVRARRVGDARPAVLADTEAVNDPQVGALDRLDQLAGRLDHVRGRERLREPKVGVAAA